MPHTICQRCVMPASWSGLEIGPDGVCSMCHSYDARKTWDWGARSLMFQDIVTDAKRYARMHGASHDCIIGFSGGKDSTWIAYSAVKNYGLRPLLATFDHGFEDEVSHHNLYQVPKNAGLDHVTLVVGNDLRNKMMRHGLDSIGDFCLHCHRGVGAWTARAAYQWNAPLVLWGEPPWYDTEVRESGEAHFARWFSGGLADEQAKPDGVTWAEMTPFLYPHEAVVRGFAVKDTYLGNFEEWDAAEHADILSREWGWRRIQREGIAVDYDKCDCWVEPLRRWYFAHKKGTQGDVLGLSKQILAGKITRDQALRIIEQDRCIVPDAMDILQAETGLREKDLKCK